MSNKNEKYQSAGDGLFFKRGDDGKVIVVIADVDARIEDEDSILDTFTIDAGIWASLVLNMTQHGEQPNHWPVFMMHHLGKKNVIGYDGLAFDAYVAGYEFGRDTSSRFEDVLKSFARWFFGSWTT